MENAANCSFNVDEPSNITNEVGRSNQKDFEGATLAELHIDEEISHSCSTIPNRYEIQNCSGENINGYDSPTVVITEYEPEYDTEYEVTKLRTFAQIFVADLISKAREKVSCRGASQHRVR